MEKWKIIVITNAKGRIREYEPVTSPEWVKIGVFLNEYFNDKELSSTFVKLPRHGNIKDDLHKLGLSPSIDSYGSYLVYTNIVSEPYFNVIRKSIGAGGINWHQVVNTTKDDSWKEKQALASFKLATPLIQRVAESEIEELNEWINSVGQAEQEQRDIQQAYDDFYDIDRTPDISDHFPDAFDD